MKPTGERLAAACGALYVALLVGGDDFINSAGEPPEPDAPLREVTAYLGKADSPSFWAGRSIGLLALCALLVFVAYLARTVREAEGGAGILSGIVLASGSVAVALQFIAAPATFAAVQGSADGLDPQVAKALLHVGAAFHLSFLPLSVFLGAAALAGLRHGVLPRALALAAGLLPVGFVAGIIGRPDNPAAVTFTAFGLSLLWFLAASVVLVRRVGRPTPTRRPAGRRAAAMAVRRTALIRTEGADRG